MGIDPQLPQIYDELRRLAAAKMRSEPAGHTLDATALVNEAWLKLNGDSFASRTDFMKAAAVAMRRILVDHARAKNADKRGGGRKVAIELDALAANTRDDELESLDDALSRLAQEQPRVAELVELRFFASLSNAEAAAILGVSPRTADTWWAFARGWLAEDLKKS